jgi:hypothetical protein
MKIAYFTDNLDLSPEEAEKFWPAYNEFEKNREELMRSRRTRSKEFRQNYEQLSDAEAEKLVDQHIEFRKKEVKLEEEFHEKLKNTLPPKKVMKFYITEVQFREHMLRQIRDERRGSGRGEGRNQSRYSPVA